MDEQVSSTQKIQWKWVGITLLFYIIFYPTPFFLAHYILASKIATLFTGIWLFAGISLIGIIVGYLSEGVTLWEPAIAAGLFIDLFFIVMVILTKIFGGGPVRQTFTQSLLQLFGITVFFFVFSLLGAWIGEGLQKLLKAKRTQ